MVPIYLNCHQISHNSTGFKSIVKNVVRDRVISGGPRLDGRTPTDIRNISAEIDLLPTVHG